MKSKSRTQSMCPGLRLTTAQCVSVALVFQHSVLMLRIVLYMWPVWLYHILAHFHKRQDFRKNGIENKMRVLIFSTRFV